jgi:hypothetical protein
MTSLKVLAGNLSAPVNLDGLHLSRYLARKEQIFQSLCDNLLLHDKILIPVQDYLGMTGLLAVVGEKNLIALLAEDRIGFIRLRGSLGYVQGDSDGTVAAYVSPNKPDSVPAPSSISAALELATKPLKDRQHLQNVVFANTSELEMGHVSGAVQIDTINDLRQTILWKDEFVTANPALLNLPGIKAMQVRVLAPTSDIANDPVDACLALHLMNIELYLARQYQCESTYTASPVADAIALKLARLTGDRASEPLAWKFLEYADVPAISNSLLHDEEAFGRFIKLSSSRHAQAFRQWFYSKRDHSEEELVKAYIDLLRDTPMTQTKTGKVIRIATSLGLGLFGLGSLVDAASSATDNFVIDKVIREASMKYFLDDLQKFSGRLRKK